MSYVNINDNLKKNLKKGSTFLIKGIKYKIEDGPGISLTQIAEADEYKQTDKDKNEEKAKFEEIRESMNKKKWNNESKSDKSKYKYTIHHEGNKWTIRRSTETEKVAKMTRNIGNSISKAPKAMYKSMGNAYKSMGTRKNRAKKMFDH